jgi:hypothetical protein
MTKKLNTSSIINELRGASPFFPAAKEDTKRKAITSPTLLPQKEVVEPEQTEPRRERYHDTMTPRNHATTVPLPDEDIVEMARKAVKQIGKEAATHRFTLDEKHMLADIEYSYRRLGVRTSENEITRIAVNYFAQDYRKNAENSILARILNRLNS